MVCELSKELNFHKKEVQNLNSEKDTLENVLSMKTDDVKRSLANEIQRIEEDMGRNLEHQGTENGRFQSQLKALKGEKTALEKQLIGSLDTQVLFP